MKRLLVLLSAFLILSTGSQAFTPDKKQTVKLPKNEVDELLEKAKEQGEMVLPTCLQDCGKNAVNGDLEPGRALELLTGIITYKFFSQ